MTEIERMFNDAMAILNINNGNLLSHNDNLCRHRIIILLEVVNDAAPCRDVGYGSTARVRAAQNAFHHPQMPRTRKVYANELFLGLFFCQSA